MELTGVTVDRAAAYGGWLSFVYALMQFFCAPGARQPERSLRPAPVLLFALLALGCDYSLWDSLPR
jgi:DHA1 family tetracycline resistance protein-like MFS transporter